MIVLAGGDGNRLASVARARYGYDRPKQFCDFGDGSLLDRTLARARQLAPSERILVATTARHRPEADECFARAADVRRVEQPDNRGTTPGILLPLLDVLQRDRSARVVLLPSDHGVGDEARFLEHLLELDRCASHSEHAFLLGHVPDELDDGFGWITSHTVAGRPCESVEAFHEKPTRVAAERLRSSGALVNTFVIAARAAALARMIARHVPDWYSALAEPRRETSREVYARLEPSDFSHDVLSKATAELGVLRMSDVGWTDLGTQARLEAFLRRDRDAGGPHSVVASRGPGASLSRAS